MGAIQNIDNKTPQGSRPRLLLLGAPVLVVAMIVIAPVLGGVMHSLSATLTLGVLYWLGCWLLVLTSASKDRLREMYRLPLARQPLELVLTWSPPIAIFFAVFLIAAPQLPVIALIAILVVSIVNGVTEEVFWRGSFFATFRDDIKIAYLYSALLFAAWHIALALIPGVEYEGGAMALIGGAAAMGFAWGWVVWRTGEMRSVTIAHVLTNIFAFSGLMLVNWT